MHKTDADQETLKDLVSELDKLSYEDKLAVISLTASECDRRYRTKTLHISANRSLTHLRKVLMLMRSLSNPGRIRLIRIIAKSLNCEN
jgi:hypothetical protein